MEVRKLDVDKNLPEVTAKARRVNPYQKNTSTGAFRYENDEADLVPVIHKGIQKPDYDAAELSSDVDHTEHEQLDKPDTESHKVAIKVHAPEAEREEKAEDSDTVADEEVEPIKMPEAADRETAMPAPVAVESNVDRSWLWLQGTLMLAAAVLTVAMLGVEQRVLFTDAGVETKLQFSWPQVTDKLSSLRTELFAHVNGS